MGHIIQLHAIHFFDPLDQFDVIQLFPSISYALTNLTVILLLNCLILAFLIYATIYPHQTQTTSPSVVGDLVWNIYEMLATLTESNIRLSKQVYFPLLFYIFVLILVSNLLGMIPFYYTVTSSFIFTFYLALALFTGINLIGTYQHAYSIFAFGVPTGSPLVLAPLIAAVELISYFSRIFSLSIRLFANMMAGHTLLKILIGFSWVMLNSQSALILFSAFPWVVVTLVMGLEFVIAMLQAYVFVVLISLYINDVVVLH